MEYLIKYVSIFLIFCFVGWCIEVCYRSFKTHHLVNPGFMVGCALPIYGTGCVILYAIADLEIETSNEVLTIVVKCLICALLMTVVEYIAGLISLKVYHNRLWDYSNRWGNIQGIICPRFSLYWAILSVVFILGVYPLVEKIAEFIYVHQYMYLLLGIAIGIFLVDLFYSLRLMDKLRDYAKKHNIALNFEKLKVSMRTKFIRANEKTISSFNEFKLRHKLAEIFDNKHDDVLEKLDDEKENIKKK